MRFRTSYSKELRDEACEENQGLFTIDYETPDGNRVSVQGKADDETLKRIRDFHLDLIRRHNEGVSDGG